VQVALGQRLSILGLFVGFIGGLPRLFLPIAAMIFSASKADRADIIVPAIAAGVVAISLLFQWIHWTRFQYFIGDEDIRIESGLLSRNARSIPYERIQDVSIEQKLLARIFGLGEVKFETGGGKGDEGTLSYVGMQEAERLRELVRDRNSGVATDEEAIGEAVNEEADTIFAMDTKRVVTFGFYSFSLVIFAVLGGLAQQFDFLLPFDVWDIGAWLGVAQDNGVAINNVSWNARIFAALTAFVSLIAIGVITGIIRTALREYGFRLDRTAKGFRRRRGMLTLTDVVMPAHRIQAAIISTGPIRKRRGWYAIEFISLAGGGGEQKDKGGGNHIAAPFATLDEIQRIAHEAGILLPQKDITYTRGKAANWFDRWLIMTSIVGAIMTAAMLLTNIGQYALLMALIPIIHAVMLYADWRNNRYAYDGTQLFVGSGWWNQEMGIASYVKIQSADVAQGPLNRLRYLANLNLGIAGGSMSVIALPIAQAREMQRAIIDTAARVDYSQVSKK
jgi:putative membrane protein